MNNLKLKVNLKSLLLVGILFTVLFYSCVPTKTVREENKTVPNQYADKQADATFMAPIKWKDYFLDTNLVNLIETALANNQELNIMLQHVAIANNVIKTKTGEYLPFVDIYAGAEVEKASEFTRNGAVERQLNIYDGEKFPEPLNNFSAGISVSWELDIWEKLRNEKKAAVLEYLASVEGKNFMVTLLVSEIANTYYELLALDNQLIIIDQNLEIQQNALQMIRLQKEAARTTQLAVRRFEADVFKNQSNKYVVKQRIIETENRINFLVGRFPQPITRDSQGFITKNMTVLTTGIPSHLLANRTDIKKAELELEASKLSVKIAKAHFYPSVGIRSGIGLEAFKTKFLTETPNSLIYSLMGDVVSPLINRNAIKAAYSTANNQQLQAVFEYEKTILNAYIEVENQLSNLENLKKSYALKEQQVKALEESIDLSILLFKSARAEYTEVLLTQREALDSKLEIIETKKEQLLSSIKLYQAIGGGWN